MKKYRNFTVLFIALALVISPNIVWGEETASVNTTTSAEVKANVDINMSVEQKRLNAEKIEKERATKKEAMQNNIEAKKEVRASTTSAIKDRQENMAAKEAEIKAKREEMKTKMEDRREELKAKMGEKRAEIRVKTEERIHGHIEWMEKRFNAAVERLEKLTTRIESRITKLKSEGKDTLEAERNVADAKAKISLAKTDIAKISTAVDVALDKDELRGAWGELKTLAETIKTSLKSAHESLVKAIGNIKGLGVDVKVDGGATTTAEQN
jgi:chromosome segregation ATPase